MSEFIDSSGTIGRPSREPTDAVVDIVANLCRQGRFLEAHETLERAAAQPGFNLSPSASARFRSYYGLTMALALGEVTRGEKLCREALEAGGGDPEMSHNLGMVYLRCRRRDLAFRSFQTALRVAPYYPETQRTIDRLGRRRRPLFRFLDRDHILNRMSGRLIHRVRRAWASLHQAQAA